MRIWRPFPLLLLFLLAACGTRAPLLRGPVLQQGASDGVVITWRTEQPMPSVVEWGLAPGVYDRRAGTGTPTTDHAVAIDGLPPRTALYYRVATPAGGWVEGRWRTFAAPGEPAPLLVWILGDSGTGGVRQHHVNEAMREHLAGRRVDVLLHLGDIAYESGTEEELQQHFFEPHRQDLSHMVVYPALGNHEARSLDPATDTGPWFDAFVLPTQGEAGGVPSGTERYYSFSAGNAHFVVIDTSLSDRTPGSPMLRWLEADLAAAADFTWRIAVFHHPPYTKGTHQSDEETELASVRDHLVPVLEAGGVDVVFAGHSHSYERSGLVRSVPTPELLDEREPFGKAPGAPGTVYVVAGHGGRSTGGPLRHPLMVSNTTEYGSVLLEIEGDELRVENVLRGGAVHDRFTLLKPGQ